MECILDEKVDQKVREYLREYHAEYRNTKQIGHMEFEDRIDDCTVAKDGTLTWGAGVTDTKAEALLQALTAIG